MFGSIGRKELIGSRRGLCLRAGTRPPGPKGKTAFALDLSIAGLQKRVARLEESAGAASIATKVSGPAAAPPVGTFWSGVWSGAQRIGGAIWAGVAGGASAARQGVAAIAAGASAAGQWVAGIAGEAGAACQSVAGAASAAWCRVPKATLNAIDFLGSALGDKDLQGQGTPLDHLRALAIAPLAAPIALAQLVGDVVGEAENPVRMNPLDNGTCAATTADILLPQEDSAEYVRLIAGLASLDGTAQMTEGDILRRASDWDADNTTDSATDGVPGGLDGDSEAAIPQ